MSAKILRFHSSIDLRKAAPKPSLWQRLWAWLKPMNPFHDVPAHRPKPAKVFKIKNPPLYLLRRRRAHARRTMV